MNILFEVSPVDPKTGIATTFRFSSMGASSAGTQLDNKEWKPVLISAPDCSVAVFSSGQVQPASISWGNIQIALSTRHDTLKLASWVWFNAPCRVWFGREGQPFTSYRKFFEGRCGAQSKEGLTLTVGMFGSDQYADTTDLLTETYAGTGGAEGKPELKGTFKPVTYGYALNVQPILIDAANLVYQFHNGAAADVVNVYENAYPITDTGAVATAGDYASLIAVDLKPGEWAKAPGVGMFRLGGQPSGKITADVGGAIIDGAFASTLATIVPAILRNGGVLPGQIDNASFSPFAAMDWSLYATDNATSIGETARGAITEAGGYLFVGTDGKWRAADFFASRPTIALNADRSSLPLVVSGSTKQESAFPPTWRLRVGADRCWSVHSSGEIAKIVATDSEEADAANQVAKDAKAAADEAHEQAELALSRLRSISDDDVLDRSEKPEVVRTYQVLQTSKTTAISKASGLGVTAEANTMANTFTALTNYLNGLSPAWSDYNSDTPINRADWNSYWNAAENALEALTQANYVRASKTANWSDVSGVGTPQANATVGAVVGINLTDTSGKNLTATDVVTSQGTSKDTSMVNGVSSVNITQTISSTTSAVNQARSDIDAEIQRAKGAEGTINSTIYNLRTDVNNNSSAISNETTQRVANGVSLASQIQNVQTNYQNADSQLGSRITDVNNSLSNGQTAIAQRTTTLESNLQSNASTISQVSAAVTNEATTRANADNALTSQVNTLTSNINGVSANVAVNAGAISTLKGKTDAYWSATTSVSNGNRAQLTVFANNGGAGVDIVGDVNITGGVRIGGSYANSLAGQANAAAPLTLYDPSGYLYSLAGMTATKTGQSDFQGNIYSREGFTGSCVLQGTLPSGYECFFGLIENRNYNSSYQNINYAWYTDGNGNIRNWEPGNFPFISNYGAGANFKIVYDGRTVSYYVENNLIRQLGSSPNRTFYAALALKTTGSTYKLGSFSSGNDNSLVNSDPAQRINQGGTQINGGMIQAYSIDASRLNVGSLSAISGTIGTLRTATSGQRVELSDNGFRLYNSAGVLVIQLGY